MDLILNVGDSVKIPENCTVIQRDGMDFFEPVKPSDRKSAEKFLAYIKAYKHE